MVDTSNTGPDAGLETQNGSEITENKKQEIISSRGESREQAGQVDVETEKPSGGEFPQTVLSVEKQKPPTPNIVKEIPTEKISQKPADILATPISEADAVSDSKNDIQKIKSSNDVELGGRLAETTKNLAKSRERLAESRRKMAESRERLAENR
jgi:hypothetical protein